MGASLGGQAVDGRQGADADWPCHRRRLRVFRPNTGGAYPPFCGYGGRFTAVLRRQRTEATIAMSAATWKEVDGELKPFNGVKEAAWAAQAGSQEAFLACPVCEVV